MKSLILSVKEKFKKKQIFRDKIILYVWPLVACGISFLTNAQFYFSMFLFMGLPTLFLFYRNKKKIKKILLFSFASVGIAIVADYIAIITGTWAIPSAKYFLFGQATPEDVIWTFIAFLFLISYYEYFMEYAEKDAFYKPRLKYFYLISLIILAVFSLIYFFDKNLLYVNYFYLKLNIIILMLPAVIFLFKFPKLFIKFIKTEVYLVVNALIYEFTALSLNQWEFPGKEVIGMIKMGNLALPFEELLFIVLITMGILSWYEFFDDDCK